MAATKKVAKIYSQDSAQFDPAAFRMAAAFAALKVKGVDSLAGVSSEWDGSGSEDVPPGTVVLKERAGLLKVEINITAKFGEKLPILCVRIQQAIRTTLEAMTERTIESVAVAIRSIAPGSTVVRNTKKVISAKPAKKRVSARK